MVFETEAKNTNTGIGRHTNRPDGGSTECDALGRTDCSGKVQPRKKPVVLVLAGSYLPGYKAGGPIRSIANLVEALGDELDYRIVTSDRDLGEPKPYSEIEPNRWTQVGKARVMYVPVGPRSLWNFIMVLSSTPADILYLNSFFDRKYSMLPALLRRLGLLHAKTVILAPRGEFSTGALQLKPWRKQAYIAMAGAIGLYRDLIWHASSQYEERDIRRAFRGTEAAAEARPIADGRSGEAKPALKIVTALDVPQVGTSRPSETPAFRRKPAGTVRLVFLSRICRKKNLDGAISMLNGLSGQVHFTIYGPAEDHAYWQTCQNMISSLPSNITVEYAGAVRHNLTEGVLSQNDVFFLPTLGENYGHVILEALRAGCPIVIGDQTPWRNLECEGVGWDLPLNEPKRFQQALQTCIDMAPEPFAEFSRRAKAFGMNQSTDAGVLEQNTRLFCGLPGESNQVFEGEIARTPGNRAFTRAAQRECSNAG
jgi:glycosyltransferase involved in cell wall biosynthesis